MTGWFQALQKSNHKKLFFTFLLFVASLLGLTAQDYFNNLEDSIQPKHWLNIHTIDSGFAHSGYYVSHADSAMPYGLGLEVDFPEQYKNRNTIIKVEGWIKSNKVHDEAAFVLSVIQHGKQVFWKGINLSSILLEKDKWYFFSDSILIAAGITNDGIIKSYLWNSDAKNTVSIDDLKFEFELFNHPTFLPDIEPIITQDLPGSITKLFSNKYYQVSYNSGSKEIVLHGDGDSSLINNISYCYEGQLIKQDKFSRSLNQFDFKGGKRIKNGRRLTFESRTEHVNFQLILYCFNNSQELKFEVEEKYKSRQEISREAIIFDIELNISEIYRANRMSATKKFDNEYWLDKQGVKFGSGNNSLLIYNQSEVSSLQLDNENKQLLVNLDFEKDHPFLHFPLNPDTTDYKLDWSKSTFEKGDKRTYSFSVFVGVQQNHIARFMKNPHGFLSTYIWTEHADFTNMRTNRATYFGSERITQSDSATGGFVKYQIPVSKSVFYNNPNKVTNSQVSAGDFTELESSIVEDSLYLDFLEQVWKKGSEICLHTPENFTSNDENMEEALGFVFDKFRSPSWIDHGYNNGLNNNREDLVCDGTLKKSSFYAMKMWKKYGVKYFWNSYYEDYLTFEKWRFSEFLDQPYNGFGDFFPNPDFWLHQTRTKDLIHWPTKSVLYVESDDLWNYRFNREVLNAFADSWGVEINHCYPAWADPAKAFWVYNNDFQIVAAPGFNRALEHMALLRDQKKLNVTTIQKFLDYQQEIQKVAYEILKDGRIKITNTNNITIKGLSFATKAKFILVDDISPAQKIVGDDIVFWFDLAPGETKLIRTID